MSSPPKVIVDDQEMRVLKRSGKLEEIAFDKILKRVKTLGTEAGLTLNYSSLVMKVIEQLHDGITTKQIDELTAQQCASMVTVHPDYSSLAARIVVSNHQKNTSGSFKSTISQLYHFKDIHNEPSPLIAESLWVVTNKYQGKIENCIDYQRDFLIDYFGFKTLERAYLMRCGDKMVERPQHMWMRVALGVHTYQKYDETYDCDIDAAIETYNLMSQKYFIHATPTLFNAGTPRPQLSSCYLVAMENDSINGIYNTLKDCALISKWAGGIGVHIHNIRATGSHIRGTNGTSNGLVPMLRVFNDTARYVDQGGNKRNGSFAIYLEPWHKDIEVFLDLKKNTGDEELRARDLFYALWIPDLFMKRVKANQQWTLMCPDVCPDLAGLHGSEFEEKYIEYERIGNSTVTVSARELWFKILDSQMETGTPYLLYKDSANAKSNQQNLGTIRSSNLCAEIIEYSSDKETAVCNLASVALSSFVKSDKTFDYNRLHEVTCVVARNLNKVIDVNFYPTEKTHRSNKLHRPIGIGVQGLADVFMLMDIPFHSEQAKAINKNIFETMYHAAILTSCNLAKNRYYQIIGLLEDGKKSEGLPDGFNTSHTDRPCWRDVNEAGIAHCRFKDEKPHVNNVCAHHPYFDLMLTKSDIIRAELENLNGTHLGAYSSFQGSPASFGKLQFDLWGVTPSDRYDWAALKALVMKYGLRNSLSLAPMPTASTSQILGNNECFEPITSNIYTRRTIAGEFVIANKYMMRDLIQAGMWNSKVKDNIIANKGSIQQLTDLPQTIRDKYKIVWEMPMRHLIDMASDRGAYVCQSQSLNLWVEDPNYSILTSMHFYAWQKGLKTGIYYLRRKPKHQPQQFTLEPEKNEISSPMQEDEPCEMCSG
jgi:ribonucleotide reductase alpha subunit